MYLLTASNHGNKFRFFRLIKEIRKLSETSFFALDVKIIDEQFCLNLLILRNDSFPFSNTNDALILVQYAIKMPSKNVTIPKDLGTNLQKESENKAFKNNNYFSFVCSLMKQQI